MIVRCLAAILMLASSSANASVEVRGSYRLTKPSTESLNQAVAPYPAIQTLAAWAADVLFYLPSMPVGLGGRYENYLAVDQNSTGQNETEWTRVSVLINSRLIDEIDYFVGPIGSIAVSNKFRARLTPRSSTLPVEYRANGNLSASVGAEAGYKLNWFNVSLETGYLYAPLGNLQDSFGQTLNTPGGGGPASVDLSGAYASVSIGAAF